MNIWKIKYTFDEAVGKEWTDTVVTEDDSARVAIVQLEHEFKYCGEMAKWHFKALTVEWIGNPRNSKDWTYRRI
jgi:hypothetical protein